MFHSNFYSNSIMTQVLQLNTALAKSTKPLVYWKYATGVSDAQQIADHIKEVHSIDENQSQQTFLQILYSSDKMMHADKIEWSSNISSALQTLVPDMEYFDLISKALSDRQNTIKVFKHKGTYFVLVSTNATVSVQYKTILASMLLEHSHSKELVIRLSEAIQSNQALELTKEEEQLISEYLQQANQEKYFKALLKLLEPKRLTNDINSVLEVIREYEQMLQRKYEELKRIQLMDYGVVVGLNQETQQEFETYLKENKDMVVYAHTDGARTSLTIQSTLYIDQTQADFIKDTSVADSRHPLYGATEIVQLLKDVIDQRLRIPITANFLIRHDYAAQVNISGVNEFDTTEYYNALGHKLRNSHINRYNCFDGYKAQILNAYASRDFIIMFETMRMATASINLFDSTVFEKMLDQFVSIPSNHIVEYKENNQWNKITMEEYYEKTESIT